MKANKSEPNERSTVHSCIARALADSWSGRPQSCLRWQGPGQSVVEDMDVPLTGVAHGLECWWARCERLNPRYSAAEGWMDCLPKSLILGNADGYFVRGSTLR